MTLSTSLQHAWVINSRRWMMCPAALKCRASCYTGTMAPQLAPCVRLLGEQTLIAGDLAAGAAAFSHAAAYCYANRDVKPALGVCSAAWWCAAGAAGPRAEGLTLPRPHTQNRLAACLRPLERGRARTFLSYMRRKRLPRPLMAASQAEKAAGTAPARARGPHRQAGVVVEGAGHHVQQQVLRGVMCVQSQTKQWVCSRTSPPGSQAGGRSTPVGLVEAVRQEYQSQGIDDVIDGKHSNLMLSNNLMKDSNVMSSSVLCVTDLGLRTS